MSIQGRTGNHVRLTAGYEKVQPLANYAPWLSDEAFQHVYRTICDYTLVDIYRCYSLWKLVEQSGTRHGDLLEVGVWRGGTGALIAYQAARTASRAVAPHVFLADTFSGVVKAGERDSYYRGGEHANTSVELVEGLLDELQVHNTTILCGVFPEDTGDVIEDRTFSFCHVDVDVYQSASDVFSWVWPKMEIGGVIVYDDYGFYGCEGVTAHVNEQFPSADRMIVHNLNGQAIMVKTGASI